MLHSYVLPKYWSHHSASLARRGRRNKATYILRNDCLSTPLWYKAFKKPDELRTRVSRSAPSTPHPRAPALHRISAFISHSTATMSSVWSDNASTLAGPSWGAMQRQVTNMYEVIKEQRGNKELAIIAVVPEEYSYELELKCERRPWEVWKGKLDYGYSETNIFTRLSRLSVLTANASSGRSLVLVTTSDWLQETIEEVHDLQKHSSMIILASTDVSTISFSVGSRIDTLTILRCRRGRGHPGWPAPHHWLFRIP